MASFVATVTYNTFNGALLAPLMAPPLPVTSPTPILCDSHVQIVQRRAPHPPLRALTEPGFNGAPPPRAPVDPSFLTQSRTKPSTAHP